MNRRLVIAATAAAALVLTIAATSAAATSDRGESRAPSRWDWPTYGQNAQHTFSARTTLERSDASRLRPAWEFRTGDAVTATPTVVGGTVYVGSWDGFFYALDLRTGSLRWKFALDAQPAVTPQPGVVPRDFSSDGGMVTSSAWFEPGHGRVPDVVVFGGGYTLYAIDAHTGALRWKHAYTGRPDLPPDPMHDDTRIFSSPVVVHGLAIIGISADGGRGRRGYIVAASMRDGNPIWVRETDVDTTGTVLNDGCGNVWSSGTLLPRDDLVVFDVADCNFSDGGTFSESIIALRARDGTVGWKHRPARHDVLCDLDFGATTNAGIDEDGRATFLGVGGKDGTYYSLDPRTGQERWHTNVVFGGFAGGFIATTAFDGHRVYGSTALGDFGRFESNGPVVCDPADPRDTPLQEPTAHAFDARAGKVIWQADQSAAFGPTTVAGGMTFHGNALDPVVQVRDARSGTLLATLPLAAPNWSGDAVVGDAIVLGTGASQQGSPDGIVAFTPEGRPPRVPRD